MTKLLKISVLLIIVVSIFACKNKPTIDTPIIANSFHDFLLKVDSSCKNIERVDCEHIWAFIQLTIPEAKNSNYNVTKEYEHISEEFFSKINGKTPRELLQFYKSEMMNIVQLDMEKDKKLVSELDDILSTYNATAKYAKRFTVNGVKNSFLKNSANVMWNIYNNSKFNVKQIVGRVDYYDGDKLIFKSEDFVHKFAPELQSSERLTILVNINIEPDTIRKLKLINDMRVDVKFKAMNVNSPNYTTLIFEMPESYNQMKEMLKRSEMLYKERINLINNIHVE